MNYEINQEARHALNRLASLPGMYRVKQQVEEMIQLARVTKLRARQRLHTKSQSNHMLFTGNPGTGKTTAARLIGEAFAAIGLLKPSGDTVPFVEVHHSTITHSHVGQSEKNIVSQFKKAMGGVLFIDEAYAFIGASEHRTDEKVIATIVQCIEDMRDDVVVIAAGYPNKMAEFLRFNPGLPSRFPTTIHFQDYSVPDLILIARQMLSDQDFTAGQDYLEALGSVLWLEKSKPHFGNARTVRNHIERSIRRHSIRISQLVSPSREDLMTLRSCDVVHDLQVVRANEKEILLDLIREAQSRLLELELRDIVKGKIAD